ncbi:FUSC family protein [Micromonospora sp. NPDC007271]|uniref:FUSC family protein n=1 Tax=Micromonospora sp. NPDC007271 TaxID=3154587 RepID=UPI00340CF768
MAEQSGTRDEGGSWADAVAGRAGAAVAQAPRRVERAGRLRKRQLGIMVLISVQAGLAAALSWVVARDLLHNPSPVFAPSAAVGTIVSAIGQRGRRTAETMLGVGLGILVGDAVLLKIGYGPWQVGFVVTVALLVAFVLVGRSGALVAQAGGTAVLLATLAPVTPNLEWPRIVQASVGGLVGLAVVVLLVPVDPMRILNSAAAPVFDTLTAQLDEVAGALAARDSDRAVRARGRLRGMGDDLARLKDALSGAQEVVTLSPVRWRRRQDVERYHHGALRLERVILECRLLARWAATAVQRGERVPEELVDATRRLAEAIRLLHRISRTGRDPQPARDGVLAALGRAGEVPPETLGTFGEAFVTQLRTVASDLLRATGEETDAANRMVHEAVTGQSRPDR